jgi:DNA-binding CsgD family transcriptional regulator
MLPPTFVAILELLSEELSESEIAVCLGVDKKYIQTVIEMLMNETNTNSLVSLLKESIKRKWIS